MASRNCARFTAQTIRVWSAGLISVITVTACAPGSKSVPYASSPAAASGQNVSAVPLPEPFGAAVFEDAKKTNEAAQAQGATQAQPAFTVADNNPGRNDVLCGPGKTDLPDVRCPRCLAAPFQQPSAGVNKLEILLVADTSESADAERAGIVRGVTKVLAELSDDADYTIGILAAHSDFAYGGSAPSSKLGGKVLATFKKSQYSRATISAAVGRTLLNMPRDRATDGGEAGLYSLHLAITKYLAENKQKGFFDDKAALAVIFMSDENDICSYDVNYPAGTAPKACMDLDKTDKKITVEQRANRVYCKDPQGNPIITAESVYKELKTLKANLHLAAPQAAPLIISGIVYTDSARIPPPQAKDKGTVAEKYWPEKERGYGYLDLIHLNGDQPVDLAEGEAKGFDFSEGLSKIGKQAAIKMVSKGKFTLNEGMEVDPATICVLVDGKEAHEVQNFEGGAGPGMSYAFQPASRELDIQGIGPRNASGAPTKVEMFYCEPPSVMDFNKERHQGARLPTLAEHYAQTPLFTPKWNACSAARQRTRAASAVSK